MWYQRSLRQARGRLPHAEGFSAARGCRQGDRLGGLGIFDSFFFALPAAASGFGWTFTELRARGVLWVHKWTTEVETEQAHPVDEEDALA